ncbi:open rectifier potassium channel protein 1 isoform X1 [Drosophila serrata]|uniref:open rectifier potassium channel protein 1 isoform X1 n=1 Tax=Drosophila serrata TaxID=7274 RepID=UPI000A1D2577|nr:open rectifier potassium channel protein 1 isoform X1 [Drosophila serrata]XP_020805059.1 open rectifier potassium channel protein 1 isoform X1 [Drosophila serrata]XP_020805061.1 open rectifier potassium channel protein 1 isoform X1 [Drosophila serrata]
MSPNRWILLLIFYISYLMFGAAIYYHIEHGEEKEARAEKLKERIEINAYLLEELSDKNVSTQNEILDRITAYCGKPVTDYTKDEHDIPYTWTFYHAFFFAFTVCSTVGYGNISPTTFAGRMIMIAYSVIGIPVNGILFAGLGEYFGRTFEAIYRRYKKYKMSTDMHYVPPQLGLITTVVIALIPGIALFLLLPSWVFTYFENWPYSISLYYSYVTTTTIGFGDYVPTFGPNQPREFGGWFVVYQIFVIVWFIFSLGYLVMIMTFITRGLQSKKLAYLEQQLSSNLKATQNRIWTGVTKDVGYLRRMLNELYILKVKPVYTDLDIAYTLPRSASCPELSMYRVEPAPIPSRKRAFSVCADLAAAQLQEAGIMVHASSDTELSKLDREKTFETAEAYRQTTDLLAKVVSALATVKPPPPEQEDAALYGGYHGFSDSQILASEWSFSTVNEFSTSRRPRARACSDFNLEAPRWQSERPLRSNQHNEWTWSGDNQQIQEAFNQRYKGQQRPNGATMVHLEPDALEEQLKKPSPTAGRVKKFSMPDGLRRLFPFQKKRPSQDLERKLSVVSVPEGIASQQQPRSPLDYYSNTVTAASSQSYLRNGRGLPPPFESNGSLASTDGGLTNLGFQLEDGSTGPAPGASSGAYQRRAAAGKRRRESIYTQNPAPSARRGSMYPPTAHALAQMQMRRGSLANSGSGSAAMAAVAARRGSLFPATAAGSASSVASAPRRSSIFSVTSEKDMNVLEQTTIADLIRALEVVHTHAVLDEQQQQQAAATATGSKGSRKQRKMGNAGLDPPQLPPILSLFAGDQTRSLQAAAANRLYARRSTIVGTMSPVGGGVGAGSTARSLLEPPPSYTERAGINQGQSPAISGPSNATSGQSKFRRRFSVRPTALQIPPGQAPPPGASLAEQSLASASSSSQSALQRRLSLRPSPLARELSPTSPTGGSSAVGGAVGGVTEESGPASAQRLLPLPAGTRPSTSSTHSPLSRIVQISQAQRKSSMPTTGPGSPPGNGSGTEK